MKKLTLTALAALLVSSGAMAADTWNGNINFTGTITNNSCKITNVNGANGVDSADISIDFGNVNADQITGTALNTTTPYFPASALGGTANASNTITLTCDASKTASLAVTLAATENVIGTDLIYKPNGNAEGVGVAIYSDKSSTIALNLKSGALPIVVSKGADDKITGASFTFAAGLVKTATTVTPGTFSGNIPFRVVYQ